jgi:MFS family permease
MFERQTIVTGAESDAMNTVQTAARPDGHSPAVNLLLNVGHAIDHIATAVATIAVEFGHGDWTDLMPYSVGAFALFGLGALPAGRLGDLWGRRVMMIIFFFGMGVSAMLVALTNNAWQLAAALTLMGAFAAIYHPVGIPMLVQGVKNPGAVIGLNGLAGNLGIAVAALVTGFAKLSSSPGWSRLPAESFSQWFARRKPKRPPNARAAKPRSR